MPSIFLVCSVYSHYLFVIPSSTIYSIQTQDAKLPFYARPVQTLTRGIFSILPYQWRALKERQSYRTMSFHFQTSSQINSPPLKVLTSTPCSRRGLNHSSMLFSIQLSTRTNVLVSPHSVSLSHRMRMDSFPEHSQPSLAGVLMRTVLRR